MVLQLLDYRDCVVADDVQDGERVLLFIVGEVEGEVTRQKVEGVGLVDLLPFTV